MSSAAPTDSVLRRHYEATHKNQAEDNKSAQTQGGVFSWLKRLFGG